MIFSQFKCCGGNGDPPSIKAHCQDCPDLCVWYSPELDQIMECTRDDGFMFKNEEGEFHLNYLIHDKIHPFKTYEFYLIGELGEVSEEDGAI